MKFSKKMDHSLWWKLQQLAEKAPWMFVLVDKDGEANILTNLTPKSSRKVARLTVKTIKDARKRK